MEKKLTAEQWLIDQGYTHIVNIPGKGKTEITFQHSTVIRLLSEYASQECSSKDERIKELEEELAKAMKAHHVINELLKKGGFIHSTDKSTT